MYIDPTEYLAQVGMLFSAVFLLVAIADALTDD